VERFGDPSGLATTAGVLGAAGFSAAVDGPLPVGDLIAIGILIVGGAILVAIQTTPFAEPSTNKSPYNRPKHEKGNPRRKRNRGGERGDARRNLQKPKNPKTQPPKDDPRYKRPGPKPKATQPGEFDPENGRWH
jgi:hypothetical protein